MQKTCFVLVHWHVLKLSAFPVTPSWARLLSSAKQQVPPGAVPPEHTSLLISSSCLPSLRWCFLLSQPSFLKVNICVINALVLYYSRVLIVQLFSTLHCRLEASKMQHTTLKNRRGVLCNSLTVIWQIPKYHRSWFWLLGSVGCFLVFFLID